MEHGLGRTQQSFYCWPLTLGTGQGPAATLLGRLPKRVLVIPTSFAGMQMYVHVSEGPEGLRAFETHLGGLSPPVAYGQWKLINRLIICEDDDDRPIVRTKECLDDLRTYGSHLTEHGQRISDHSANELEAI